MSIEKFVPWTAGLVCLGVVACSGGGGGSSGVTGSIATAVQDLTVDPDGLTTVITFDRAVSGLLTGNFVADAGQNAIDVDINGAVVTVEWDARVTPSSQVRVAGIPSLSAAFQAVTTTDSAAPTFVISNADQIAGLGADEITVQFSGARVVESEAEDLANWTLTVGGLDMDLTGSTFDLDTSTQTLTITTGDMANLHATFTLAADALHSVADVSLASNAHNGNATGDTTVPTLVSVEQNLAVDEFGRTVDLTFSEAMDPVFSTDLASFGASSPDLAMDVEQPFEDVLRVTFNNPMVPGLDALDLTDLVDAHGNSLANQSANVVAGSTVANDWAVDPELNAVSNEGGDEIVASFDQALDPDTAEDWARWSLTIDPSGAATVIDLSTARLDYDLPNKTLVITFADGTEFTYGDDFTFEAAAGNEPIDVDGQDFVGSFDGQVGGDSVAPVLSTATQKRGVDHTGKTLDVTFDEDLDETSAETLGNWSVSGVNVLSATLLANLNGVRLVCDDIVVPGDATLDVSGLTDLAGNSITAIVAHAIDSSDTTAPAISSAIATAVEGSDNDTLVVTFNDAMLESEVEDPTNWSVESPVGAALDVSLATIDYRAVGHVATLTFGAAMGLDLQVADTFQVALANMRDVAGNTVTSAAASGTVGGERTLPSIVSVWVETAALNQVHVRFSEPCELIDDITGLTEYVVRNSSSVIKGYPTSAVADSDALGVELVFGFAVVAGSDTLDVHGVLDLAGNPMFPADGLAVEVEDASEVAFDVGVSTLVTQSGEHNDVITVMFDRKPSPWTLLDLAHYSVTSGPITIDLTGGTFSYDGDRTVTIVLDAVDAQSLTTGSAYDVSIDGIQSAQGIDMGSAALENILAAGDSGAPTLPIGKAKLDAANPTQAVLIEMSEALDPTDAVNPALVLLNGATVADELELLGHRTIRATFLGGVSTSDTIEVTLRDLAGNAGFTARAITSQDVSTPLVVQTEGVAVAGAGGDYVTVEFSEQVDLASALSQANYTLDNGGVSIDVTNAQFVWDSTTNEVTIRLDDAQNLQPGLVLNVQVANVYDHAGLLMSPAANVFGAVSGDVGAPDFDDAFANYRDDLSGTTIDVRFLEDVDETFASAFANWSTSGSATVTAVEHIAGPWWRVTLSAALGGGDSLQLNGLPDLAGNTAGLIVVVPTL